MRSGDVTPRFKEPRPDPAPRRPLKRGGPLRRSGARTRRQSQALRAARRFVQDRSAGLCEARKLGICGPWVQHLGAHAHHLFPEDRDRGVHDPARMVWVCAEVHDWIHRNPARAKELGLLRPEVTQ